MKLFEKYLAALKEAEDWITVSDWARKVGALFPDVLAKAEMDAKGQAQETTGLREIAARISSEIARGAYINNMEVDASERPRRVRYTSSIEHDEHVQQEIDEDVAPLKRDDIIKLAVQSFSVHEKYRVNEFDSIAKQLKQFFGLDFEVDHSEALLNSENPGAHAAENLQLLLKAHNGKKNNKNWPRFSFEEQADYIEAAIKLQGLVSVRFGIEMEQQVLGSLLNRLKEVY